MTEFTSNDQGLVDMFLSLLDPNNSMNQYADSKTEM